MFDDSILEQFEDLLSDESTIDLPENNEENDQQNDSDMKKLDANSLTLKDLLHEMEIRNLQPRGFFDDDAELLQEHIDKEHQNYIDSKRREKLEARELEASQAMIRRRKAIQEIELTEEENELKSNQRVSEWFRLIQNRCSPARCRIDVNNISARTLARFLWSDDSICSLDVSNMNLSDSSGAYLARVMKNNKAIVKLEMNENFLGSKTCTTLAESLSTNTTLKYLSIGSNPLMVKNGKATVEALVSIVRDNSSLRHLGLWRCNIGIEGGREISEAMLSNEVITCIELGHNFWDFNVIQKLEDVLIKNRSIQNEKKKREIDLKSKEKEVQRLRKKEEEEKLKKEADLIYIKEEKLKRSELRRIERETYEEEARREEEKRSRQEEELKCIELKEVEKLNNAKKSKRKNKKK